MHFDNMGANYPARSQWRIRGGKFYFIVALPLAWLLAYYLGFQSDLQWATPLPKSPTPGPINRPARPSPKTSTSWKRREPVKPIAYIFPQFHRIPENDEFWGENFTEWVNVKKVTHNAHGLETVRPTVEVGYYNLLDYSARERQGRFLRDSGFYGATFHHYWFTGRPVMDGVLQNMLKDGEPNIPFMLNWANEPWTARWDGNDASKVLLKQEYGGVPEWRLHYDWLKPFFRHPNYIRINGRIQFMIYNPSHMGDMAPRMYAAWRKWAEEDGLGGMDIMETYILGDPGFNQRNIPDSSNEFAPRSGGSFLDATEWVGNPRQGKVFHRGAAVCWDNTPRHATDGGASANPLCHYKLWKHTMVETMRRSKLEPNPHDQENFFFVNALNEWGEGNVLEPSLQWGDNYGKAFREAVDTVAQLPWLDDLISEGEKIADEISSSSSVDVCVVVREYENDWNRYDNPFRLQQLLRSLKALNNKGWRAVVFNAGGADEGQMRRDVFDTYDPRIRVVEVPDETKQADWDARARGAMVTDWVVENLREKHEACAGAKYVLFANSNYTYHASSFDAVDQGLGESDILGMKFTSNKTMMSIEKADIPWDRRCERLEDGSTEICQTATPTNSIFELGAILISASKLRSEGFKLAAAQSSAAGIEGSLRHLVDDKRWTWTAPHYPDEICHAIEGKTYLSCLRTGRFWVDGPVGPDCHGLASLVNLWGWDMGFWDMKRFRKNPFCVRHSEEKYAEVTAAKAETEKTPKEEEKSEEEPSVAPEAPVERDASEKY
jgi:hypothetical protein